jgi:GNAT superfamily N-acetyltransferase
MVSKWKPALLHGKTIGTDMRPPIDPASHAVAAALESDPFYRCITAQFATDQARRHAVLSAYLDYSIGQGLRIGRVVHLEEAGLGVAVWLLPQADEVYERERAHKHEFLRQELGESGSTNYQRMVDYMGARSRTVVASDAWYLSIVAIAPHAQGRGLGARLLAPTLAEADAARAVCYLETFSGRSRRFYERLEFVTRGEFPEPTTGAQYAILTRAPKSPAAQADEAPGASIA